MIILVTLINVLLLVMLRKITFTDEQECLKWMSYVWKRRMYSVKGIYISIHLKPNIYGHSHHIFLILAEKSKYKSFSGLTLNLCNWTKPNKQINQSSSLTQIPNALTCFEVIPDVHQEESLKDQMCHIHLSHCQPLQNAINLWASSPAEEQNALHWYF